MNNAIIIGIIIFLVIGCRREIEVRPRKPQVQTTTQDFFGVSNEQITNAKKMERILEKGSKMNAEDRARLKELSPPTGKQ